MLGRLRKLPLLQPLRDRAFRLLCLGEGVALLADQMFLVALTLLVVEIAGVGVGLGSVLAVASVPGAVLMLVGGWAADRFSPARVLVVSNTGRALLMGSLATLVLTGEVRLWHLYVLAGALGVLDAFHYPASMAVVPSVVGKERLQEANTFVQGTEQVGELVGPALAAFSVALIGLGNTFGALTLMFAVTAVVIQRVTRSMPRAAGGSSQEGIAPTTAPSPEVRPVPAPAKHHAAPGRTVGGIVEGLRYAWRDPVIRTMLFVFAAINVAAAGPILVGGAALVEQRLGGAGSLGFLLSAFGAGSLLGLLVSGLVGSPRHRGVTLLGLPAALGVGLGALGFVPNLVWAMAIAALMGVGLGYLGVALFSWLQGRVEPALQGRVMSLVMLCIVALDPVSYALAGVLVAIDLTLTFVVAGLLLLATTLVGVTSRTVRRFE